MRLVGNYVTIYPDDQLDRTVTKQFCTGTSYLLKSETNMEAVHSWTEEKTSGNWWYAAGVHLFGNRLDSQPLEQRLSGWFTYDSDLQGYLIWETAQYSNIVWDSNIKVNAYNACDAYSTALRISNGAGDGYIFYPGKPYGIDGPVGSIRAHQYRDASEDYEYVYMLGQLYQEAGYSEDAILGKIFSTLYNDGRINDDSDWFDFEREQVANLILLAEKGVFVTDFSEIAGVARIQVAATGEEKIVNVNGEAAGELAQTEISVDMAAVTDGVLSFGTASGLKFEVRLNGTAKQLANADTQATVRGGEYEKAQVDGTEAAKFTFITDLSIEEDLRNNDFTYAADKEQINADIDYLAVSLYNPYDMHITVECWFMGTDNRTVYVDDIVLEPGYNEFYISQLDSVGWGTIRQITGIRFKVAPPEGMDTYTLYCLGVYAVD